MLFTDKLLPLCHTRVCFRVTLPPERPEANLTHHLTHCHGSPYCPALTVVGQTILVRCPPFSLDLLASSYHLLSAILMSFKSLWITSLYLLLAPHLGRDSGSQPKSKDFGNLWSGILATCPSHSSLLFQQPIPHLPISSSHSDPLRPLPLV